ncbi:MAG: tryptophan 7-halogenase, partial [Verrucomicrobia bacterium]|nr:tryptophan 7-halogenase [Verrucomicrobiota bacterium]
MTQNKRTPIKRILVLGGGSAGYLAAITLKTRLPDIEVTVVHSSKLPVIGVGEGSTFTMPIYLHGYLGIDPHKFHQTVKPTYKLGIKFLWGPRDHFHYTFTNQLNARIRNASKPNGFLGYENFPFGDINAALMASGNAFEKQEGGGPLINADAAYHLENEQFVAFLEEHADQIGIIKKDDQVVHVECDEEGVQSLQLESGKKVDADLYVDASGFQSELLGKALGEPFTSFQSSLFCDRAIIGGWTRQDELLKPYTTAETMDAGWAWQIEHDDFINRGYVYSSAFISDDEAEKEFRSKNPKVIETRLIKFETGCYDNAWVKNVVSIGNSNGFVEPLEATSLSLICDHSAKLVQTLSDCGGFVNVTTKHYYNQYTSRNWNGIRRFLAMHYKFNTRLKTPFWTACQNDTDLAGAEELIKYYQACGPSFLWANEAMGASDPFGWEGYLIMLVGQKVPFRKNTQSLTKDDLNIWNNYLGELQQRADKSLSMRQSLDIIRSDEWGWQPDF